MFKKKIKNNKNRGFALIELLVVMSIITFLSSVILVSLQSARNKAKVASIKTMATQLRNQAELYYNENGNYSTVPSTAYWPGPQNLHTNLV